MRPPKWEKLLEKSQAALISAIEIFNKPDFDYREETFSLLALNAWELLLKSKILHDNNGKMRILYSYENRPTKSGPGKKKYVKRNRSGNPMTIGMEKCVNILDGQLGVPIDASVRANLEALTEVRDNAAHFMNASPRLSRQVLELGTASLRNYVVLLRKWFKRDLSRYNLYLMPLGFMNAASATALPGEKFERNLVNYLAAAIDGIVPSEGSDYHVALAVELSFQRGKGDASIPVKITNDPAAVKVQLTEEDIRAKYPWDYGELVKRLTQRYSDFRANNRFHQLKKPLMQDERYCKARYLDPRNPRTLKKDFYNPNIVNEFDKHYLLRA